MHISYGYPIVIAALATEPLQTVGSADALWGRVSANNTDRARRAYAQLYRQALQKSKA